jgi:hypothetical protein
MESWTGARIRFALAIGIAFVATAAWGQPFPKCTPVTFESGTTEGYTVSGLWHVSTTCGANTGPHTTPNVLYYGIEGQCNFDNGAPNSGNADSTLIVFPSPAEVRFNSRLGVEGGSFDLATVQFSIDGGGSWTTFLDKSGMPNDGTWHAVAKSIPGGASNTVRLRFALDTIDNQFNDGLGWMVDDIQVCYGSYPPIPASNHATLALLAAALSGLAFVAFRRRARAR